MFNYFLLISSLEGCFYKIKTEFINELRKNGATRILSSNFYEEGEETKLSTMYIAFKFSIEMEPTQFFEYVSKFNQRINSDAKSSKNDIKIDIIWANRITMSTYKFKLPNLEVVTTSSQVSAIKEIVKTEKGLSESLDMMFKDKNLPPCRRVSEFVLRKLYG